MLDQFRVQRKKMKTSREEVKVESSGELLMVPDKPLSYQSFS